MLEMGPKRSPALRRLPLTRRDSESNDNDRRGPDATQDVAVLRVSMGAG